MAHIKEDSISIKWMVGVNCSIPQVDSLMKVTGNKINFKVMANYSINVQNISRYLIIEISIKYNNNNSKSNSNNKCNSKMEIMVMGIGNITKAI